MKSLIAILFLVFTISAVANIDVVTRLYNGDLTVEKIAGRYKIMKGADREGTLELSQEGFIKLVLQEEGEDVVCQGSYIFDGDVFSDNLQCRNGDSYQFFVIDFDSFHDSQFFLSFISFISRDAEAEIRIIMQKQI